MAKGKFFVIEGSDGSGKTVQFNLLLRRLRDGGYAVRTIHFPQHGKPSSYFVDRYLNDAYGPARDLNPKNASLFYALDRFEARAEIRKWLHGGNIVLADRYVASNMGHQGSKINSKRERRAYFRWLYNLEYEVLDIPRPDLNIILNMPARVAYRLIGKKLRNGRGYLRGKMRDGHERDMRHLARSAQTYRELAASFPNDFFAIACAARGKPLPISVIHERVWNIVRNKI